MSEEIIWTKADVEAAYLMGLLNANVNEPPEGDPFPTFTRMQMEVERLKRLGFESPADAVLSVRRELHLNDNV